jgi:glycosyltransferase involved in cell wall biosynthesis
VPTLSIIIPTHKRPEILRECLKRIEQQTIADQLEVIVVSDGHDEETTHMLKKIHHSSFIIHHFEIPKSQQGVARNKGVQHATGERVLFIGDDIFLDRHACEKHAEGIGAVLGFTTWDPTVGITPVMEWLEQSGWQFAYPNIAPYVHNILPKSIQQNYTYTSHISLPLVTAKAVPFREDVTLYGWEDIEWGSRVKEEVPLFYEPDAKALHHHHLTLEQSLKRMETLGRSAVEMEKIAPQLHIVPKGFKRIAYEIFSRIPTMSGKHREAFLSGIRATK